MKRVVRLCVLVVVLVSLALLVTGVLTHVSTIAPTANQNLSGTITLNGSIENGDDISNVTYMWQDNVTGQFELNTTVYNTSVNQSGDSFANTSFDTTLLPDGVYNLTVIAYNISGNGSLELHVFINPSVGMNYTVNTSATTITIDNTAPNVTIVRPVNGTRFNGSSTFESFNATVNDTTLVTGGVIFEFDNASGVGFNVTAQNLSNNWNYSYDVSSLAEGLHTLTIHANDSAANVNNTQSIQFFYDVTGPNVTIIASQNFTTTGDEQSFNATVNDVLATVSSVIFGFDNASGTGFNVTATNTSGNWNVTYNTTTLAEGNHIITVYANDTANNTNTTQTITFGTDSTVPNVSAVSVTSITEEGGLLLVDVNDTYNKSGVEHGTGIDTCTYTVGAQTGPLNGSVERYSAVLSNLPAETEHTVTVNCTDFSGNSNASESTTFTTEAASSSSSSSSGGGGGGGRFLEPDDDPNEEDSGSESSQASQTQDEAQAAEQELPSNAESEGSGEQEVEGDSALAGQAISGGFTETLRDLSWLWITIVVVALVIGIGLYSFKKKSSASPRPKKKAAKKRR